MIISSSDNKVIVDVGSSDILFSLYSTIYIKLNYYRKNIKQVLSFFETGKCDCQNAIETARQFNLVRDELSRIKPCDAVYDYRNLHKELPWKENISKVVTSCANLYTTADGKDLLYEIICVLCHAAIYNVSVSIK